MFQSFFLYSHLFLLKIMSHFGVFLGTWIVRMKPSRTVDFRNIETLYLNRSDRLGDAIISKPFIKLLIEWLRKNGCSAEIIIIASQYNRFILRELEDTAHRIRIVEEEKNLDAYESKLYRMILKHLNFLYRTLSFRWTHGSKRDEKTLFLDLTGGGDLLSILKYKELYNPIVAGPNIFWGSHILDIAIDHSYVHYPHKNLIESYIEITEKVFGLSGKDTNISSNIPQGNGVSFRDFVYDHIGEFFQYERTEEKRGICLFVGVKEFRNLPVVTWREIISDVAKTFPDERITVLDDNTNLLYDVFSRESFASNVTVEKNTYKLPEFIERVSGFAFVAGIDGGGINMVRTLTNSCTIYTFAHHDVWCCFPGRNKYHEISGENGWQTGVASLPHSQKVGYMYKQSFWLPTFNIAGNREIFRDFDTGAFVDMIREMLKK